MPKRITRRHTGYAPKRIGRPVHRQGKVSLEDIENNETAFEKTLKGSKIFLESRKEELETFESHPEINKIKQNIKK